MKIQEINRDDRPREKALKYGIKKISDAELLAIIINSGTRNHSALEIGESLLKTYKNLYYLSKENNIGLKEEKGLKDAKTLSLLAAFEIARRIEIIKRGTLNVVTSSLELAKEYSYLQDENNEYLFLIVLDNKCRIIKEKRLSSSSSSLDINISLKDIIYEILISEAKYYYLVHNHISGDATPSKLDIIATKNIADNLKQFSINFIDHIIIGKGEYYSFLEKKKPPF